MMIDFEMTAAPSVEAAPEGTIDLGKEREIRQLRAQVAELTEQLAQADPLKHSVLAAKSYEETHGLRCGFHTRILVSMTEAKIWCTVCGAELVPMDVLREYANRERHFIEALEWLRKEKRQLREEVDHLKKERSSLRSQVKRKRASKPPPTAA